MSLFSDIVDKTLGRALGSGSVLGVDIGTSSIKVAEVSNLGGGHSLKNYGILETRDYMNYPNRALHTSSLDVVEEEIGRLLKMLISEMETSARTAVLSVPLFASFVTLLDAPNLSQSEIKQFIKIQANQYIPMPESEVSIDWFQVGQYETRAGKTYQRIMLTGVPNKIINSYKNICKMAGLRFVAAEMENSSLVGTLPSYDMPTMVIDIGAESTTALVTEGGVLKYADQTDYSAIHVTRAVSKSLDLNMSRAEDLKRQRGLGGEGGPEELTSFILPFLDVIIQEVRGVQGTYEQRYGKKVSQMTMVGGGSLMSGMDNYFSNQLNLPLAESGILVNMERPAGIESILSSLDKRLAVSIGLTKKYFQG